jgi:hypothetical protein
MIIYIFLIITASTTIICWRCHSNIINTGSCLTNSSDVKTRKRPNVVGIDMIRNNRIACHEHLKATGPDRIPGHLLKEAAKEITPALTFIFQASINQSKISSDWITAIVAPVFKKEDRGQPSNYMHISLTLICCNIMERIIHSSVPTHLENTNILSDEQHGFHKKRSCDTGPVALCGFSRFIGVSILQLFKIYRIYDYHMLTLSQ